MNTPKISAMLVRVGVFMGDHGETVITAEEVFPDETIQNAMERLLTKPSYSIKPTSQARQPVYDWRLELRFVMPVEEVADASR
jgi:aspartate-semialdehyde dehydrogenase